MATRPKARVPTSSSIGSEIDPYPTTLRTLVRCRSLALIELQLAKSLPYLGLALLLVSAHVRHTAADVITITLKSDATTQAAATPLNDPRLTTGDTTGLTFQPVAVGAFGTFTAVPAGAPTGTLVVNIPPGNGQSGFFRTTFTLPPAFSGIQLTGRANVDDQGLAFLNGHPISPSLTEFGNATISTTNPAFFKPGINELLISDNNPGGGPSGAAFYSVITFSGPTTPSVSVSLNATSFHAGQTLAPSLAVENPSGSSQADLYVGILLTDGQTVLFLTDSGAFTPPTTLSTPAQFTRMEAAPPGFAQTSSPLFSYTFPTTGVPFGTYNLFAALVRAGTLLDNRIDPGDILAFDVKAFDFTPIILTSLSSTAGTPGQLLTVTASGFDPIADLAVRFSDDRGYIAEVPAVAVSSNGITVSVPPFVDVNTGALIAGTVNVKLIQRTGATSLVSNTIGSFQIENLPTPVAPAGTVSLSFLRAIINQAGELHTAIQGTTLDTPDLRAALANVATNVAPLIHEIQAVTLDPTRTFNVGSIGGITLTVGAPELLALDRLIIGMLLAHAAPPQTGSSRPAVLSATSGSQGCAQPEALAAAQAAESSGGDTQVDALDMYMRAPRVSVLCGFPQSFDTPYLIVAGTMAVGIGIAVLTLPADVALMAVALPTAALLYLTIAQAGGEIAVGGALGQTNDSARQLVANGVNRIEELLRSSVAKLLLVSTLPTQGEHLVALASIYFGRKALIDAFRSATAAPPPPGVLEDYKGIGQQSVTQPVGSPYPGCTWDFSTSSTTGYWPAVELQITAGSLLADGPFAGTLIFGVGSSTFIFPGDTCIFSDGSTIHFPGVNNTDPTPSTSVNISGTSDGHIIAIPITPDLVVTGTVAGLSTIQVTLTVPPLSSLPPGSTWSYTISLTKQ